MAEDWFAALDKELEKRTKEIISDVEEQDAQKSEINQTLIEDFWRIWIRFNREGVHFTMEPSHSAFAQFEDFPEPWKFKPKFKFSTVNTVQLIDRTQDQGRVGDSLKAWYYNTSKATHLRMVFEYCEGEHYYKYSGWKRIFTQRVLYDATLNSLSYDKLHKILADVVKIWYESHIRRNRENLIKHLKDNYEKGETFTQ
jgi:hypothetical protein